MIRLTHGALAVMRAAGEASYPEECCGALLGEVTAAERIVTEAMPIENTSREGRRRRFAIAPADYRAAERRAQERGRVLVGFYHSHPDHPARPSAYDLEHALPWHSYVILAVEAGRAQAWTSWILAADRQRFEPEQILASDTMAANAEEGAA